MVLLSMKSLFFSCSDGVVDAFDGDGEEERNDSNRDSTCDVFGSIDMIVELARIASVDEDASEILHGRVSERDSKDDRAEELTSKRVKVS